ncbi:MAG: short-chain fatty acyl-CoA regulator family protein, partial [Pseudomonadota bacterium]|nr:short-chain fatty acyl-CoA regulator family protein [Pseudomonadota bacterium]
QRLASLREDFAFIRIDVTGRVLNHSGKLPFHLAKDEPLCAQLPLFDEDDKINIAVLQSDGETTIAVACNRHALFMPLSELNKTVYAQQAVPRRIGATCRLCDVHNCAKRSAASATKPAGLNDYIRGTTDFEPI